MKHIFTKLIIYDVIFIDHSSFTKTRLKELDTPNVDRELKGNFDNITTPLAVNRKEIQLENVHEVITPLTTPLSIRNDNYPFITPIKDVELSPVNEIQTPVNNTTQDSDIKMQVNITESHVNTRDSNNSSLIGFTPHEKKYATPYLNRSNTESSQKLKENMTLFFENNKWMDSSFTPKYDNDTPKQKDLINFITPFKDPFSPYDTPKAVNKSELTVETIDRTPLSQPSLENFSSSVKFSPLDSVDRSLYGKDHSRYQSMSKFDVTMDEVDSFIEEVLSNTSTSKGK